MKIVDVAGRAVMDLCPVAEGRGGTWHNRGEIVFGSRTTGLFPVPTSGGTPTALTNLSDTERHWVRGLVDPMWLSLICTRLSPVVLWGLVALGADGKRFQHTALYHAEGGSAGQSHAFQKSPAVDSVIIVVVLDESA